MCKISEFSVEWNAPTMSAEDPASEQKDIASEQNLSAEDLTSEPGVYRL